MVLGVAQFKFDRWNPEIILGWPRLVESMWTGGTGEEEWGRGWTRLMGKVHLSAFNICYNEKVSKSRMNSIEYKMCINLEWNYNIRHKNKLYNIYMVLPR